MTKEQKIAIAKVICEMIKADSLIDESEILDMKELQAFYSINREHMAKARGIRFADAINILKDLTKKEREQFYKKISKVSLSDGVSLSSEAMLLIALRVCLLTEDAIEPTIVSFPTSEASFVDRYIIYIENKYDKKVNEEIKNNHRLLTSLTKLYGFNFIYMPDVSDEFKEMNPEYLKDVVQFINPSFTEEDIDRTYERLCNITTIKFYEEMIINRLKLNLCKNDIPFVLLNIATSTLQDDKGCVKFNTDFLCIPIIDGIIKLIDDFIKYYQTIVSIKHTITVNGTRGRFKYFGFYKALFDFIIAPPPVLPDLIFHGQDIKDGRYKLCFRYPDGHDKRVVLTPAEYDLFYTIANKTYNEKIGGVSVNCCSNIKPTISHIKSKIDQTIANLTFPELYKPDRKGNLYVLNISADKVFVRRSKGATDYEIVPIKN